jgi:D-alanine transaminase
MTRVIYVNGRYEPYAQACIHAEDRGFQFADAVYEVCEVRGGRLVDERRHMQRLMRSLTELQMPQPMTERAWSRVLRETIRRNRVRDGLVYLQVSRGARPREFLFPPAHVQPTVVCLARRGWKRQPRPGSPSRPCPTFAGRAAT